MEKRQENLSQPKSSKDISKGSYKSTGVGSNTESEGQQYSVASSSQRSVATNTSMLWPEIQQGLRKLTDALNEEDDDVEDESYPNPTEIRKSKINVSFFFKNPSLIVFELNLLMGKYCKYRS